MQAVRGSSVPRARLGQATGRRAAAVRPVAALPPTGRGTDVAKAAAAGLVAASLLIGAVKPAPSFASMLPPAVAAPTEVVGGLAEDAPQKQGLVAGLTGLFDKLKANVPSPDNNKMPEPPAIPVADPPQPKASRVKALPVPPVSELLEAVARPNPAPGAGPVQEAAKSEN